MTSDADALSVTSTVMPTEVGTQSGFSKAVAADCYERTARANALRVVWIPAFAGMTVKKISKSPVSDYARHHSSFCGRPSVMS